MKKMSVFIVLLFALCIVLPVSAQVHLGVLGGLNLANVSGDTDDEADWQSSTFFGFGVVLDYALDEYITLHFEPMYLQKGAEINEEGYDAKLTLTYLEVPVMLRYVLGTNKNKPYIMGGPTIGFNQSAHYKDDDDDENVKDDIKGVDFGLGFGGGISLPMDNNLIFVEARYTLGVTNISKEPDFDIKTKGFQIFAGITFPLDNK
jgi:hypothetical protein